jgi:translocator assembly and maintenance protein 41
VQVDELSRDLVDWKYLYLAGRMHKPIVKTTIDSGVEGSIEYQQTIINLPAALSASLLLLSRGNQTNGTISEAALYTQIAALSYTGDPRMSAGAEDPEKVNKLVQSPGQLRRFSRLYRDALSDLETQGLLSIENGHLLWDAKNPKAHQLLWQKLPSRLQPATFEDPAMAIKTLYHDLPAIVGPAARYQSLKGLATAGPRRSWTYAMRKLSKGLLKR